jgi:DNA-binding CsgD family transcriptional regulator
MSEAEEFSTIIGSIYDAALDPALWPRVVERMTLFIGGFAACLSIKGRTKEAACITPFGDMPDAHFEEIYWDKYHQFDPRDWSLFDVGVVKGNDAFLPPEEFSRTRFYREWMEPQGVRDNPICILDRSPNGGATYGVFLPAASPQAHELAFHRMRLLVPHLQRAVRIAKSLELRKAEASTFAEVLDGLAAGVILVDGERRMVHANDSGEAMLARKSPLHAANGRVSAHAPDAQRTLHKSVAGAASRNGGAGAHGTTLTLAGREPGAHYLAHILPLANSAHDAVAALFVHDAARAAPSTPALIAEHYRLTPGEVRVLMGIAEGGGVRETAEALGIAETTVKTHLQRIFAKTGTARQADLVKLVASFSSPVIR